MNELIKTVQTLLGFVKSDPVLSKQYIKFINENVNPKKRRFEKDHEFVRFVHTFHEV